MHYCKCMFERERNGYIAFYRQCNSNLMIVMTRQHTTKPNYLSLALSVFLSFCFCFSFHCLRCLVRCRFKATRAFSSTSVHRLNNSACIYIHSTCVCIYGCSFELSPFRATYIPCTISKRFVRLFCLIHHSKGQTTITRRSKKKHTRTYFTIRTNSIFIVIGRKSKTLRREFTRRYSAERNQHFG